jgi:phospholipid-binding lipoprotein MlaA
VRSSVFLVILFLSVGGDGQAAHGADSTEAAHSPPATKGDPWEKFNRRAFAFNEHLDKILVRPASLFAHGLTPGPLGKALHNLLRNLNEPVVIANDLFQHRIARAFATIVRLALNSTIGLAGTVDVAARLQIPHHANSFGDTLGRYGVGPGPYLYLPVLGPSTVRDLFGAGVDLTLTPMFYYQYRDSTEVLIFLNVLGGLDARAEADPDLRALMSDAADPYATLRSTYLQMRQGEVDEGRRGGPILPEIEDTGPPVGSVAPAPPQEGKPADQEPSALEPAPGPIPPQTSISSDPTAFWASTRDRYALADVRRVGGPASAAVDIPSEAANSPIEEAAPFVGLPDQ